METKKRLYACPACGTERMIETNHIGSTYSGCKGCKNTIMYCMEAEAIERRKNIETITAKLKFYRYDISNEVEKEVYDLMCRALYKKGYRCMECFRQTEELKAYKNVEEVKLHTDWVTDNQWNSDKGRVFDWTQAVYPNKNIKEGYFLVNTPEMIELRMSKKFNN